MKADSVDKVVMAYFAAVTARPFTYKGVRYPVPRLTVSTGVVRGYTCPAGCGGCCPRFTLDYLPSEPQPYPMGERAVEFDGRTVRIVSDTQDEHRNARCRNLLSDGRCAVHGRQPFTCDFELIRVMHSSPGVAHITQRLFSRGALMNRTDGGKGAKCTIYPADPATVDDTVRRLRRLVDWADHFGIPTRVPQVVAWIGTIRGEPEAYSDLVLPAGADVATAGRAAS